MIERIFSGALTDEDLELYSAAREVMAGQSVLLVATDYGVPVAAIQTLVAELNEMESIYARMALVSLRLED